VANAMALVKNHMSDIDVEILQKDFSIDNTEWAALVNSAYNTAQHFVSLYDFSMLVESDDNNSHAVL
jgi:hypothetical protein